MNVRYRWLRAPDLNPHPNAGRPIQLAGFAIRQCVDHDGHSGCPALLPLALRCLLACDFSLDALKDGCADAMARHDLPEAEPGCDIGSDGALLLSSAIPGRPARRRGVVAPTSRPREGVTDHEEPPAVGLPPRDLRPAALHLDGPARGPGAAKPPA